MTDEGKSEAAIITAALIDGKGADVVQIPAREQSCGLFLHLVIATAMNARHAASLGERVVKALKQSGNKAPKTERSEEWVLIDAGDVVAHIMQPDARERYDLESLWSFEKTRRRQ
ncbi:MAG: ribosome silencing factor [Gammaproteobacteria bacterium]